MNEQKQMDTFKPTHILQFTDKKSKNRIRYWKVRVIRAMGKGKEDNMTYYMVEPSPLIAYRHGYHVILNVPEDHLKKIEQ
jgi:hypothetical protein